MPSRRRSRKTTPLKEAGFLLIVVVGFFAVTVQFNVSAYDVTPVIGATLLIFLLIGVVLYLFFLHKQRTKQKALRVLELSSIDEMTGEDFEVYVAGLLKFQGYRTQMTPRSGDYGVDIIATKNGVKTAVQVKRYAAKLDQKSIREAIAGKTVRKYGCTEAMVVTNSTFTKAAKFLASESSCILVDREVLSEWMVAFQATK